MCKYNRKEIAQLLYLFNDAKDVRVTKGRK